MAENVPSCHNKNRDIGIIFSITLRPEAVGTLLHMSHVKQKLGHFAIWNSFVIFGKSHDLESPMTCLLFRINFN